MQFLSYESDSEEFPVDPNISGCEKVLLNLVPSKWAINEEEEEQDNSGAEDSAMDNNSKMKKGEVNEKGKIECIEDILASTVTKPKFLSKVIDEKFKLPSVKHVDYNCETAKSQQCPKISEIFTDIVQAKNKNLLLNQLNDVAGHKEKVELKRNNNSAYKEKDKESAKVGYPLILKLSTAINII